MKKFIFIIISLLIALPAHADLDSSSYKIQGPTISGGGEKGLQSENYKMQDLKGQGISGSRTSDSYELQLGGIYTYEETTEEVIIEVPPAELVDIGWIRNTNIVRQGENLRITWGYDPVRPRPTKVDILAYKGPGAECSDNPDDYSEPVVSVNGFAIQYVHDGVAHDGNNWYYRVVPYPLIDGTNVLDDANNSITVGKVEVAVPANTYVFTVLPFMEDAVSLAGIIGEQLGGDANFLWWRGMAHEGATYHAASRSWIGNDRDLRIGEAFLLRATTDKSVSMVGRFGRLEDPFVIQMAKDQYHFIGFPYPTARLFETMGITPGNDDNLLRWTGAVHTGATYSGGNWVGPDTNINQMALADGRLYWPQNDFDWEIRFPGGR